VERLLSRTPILPQATVVGKLFIELRRPGRGPDGRFSFAIGELVPDEGIEPPTFGLQNRCSTAELIRRFDGFCAISEASRAQERG
jgi:hypothetical protein